MPNPRLAARYAKSLIDLALEQGKLEEVYRDMQLFSSIRKTNRDLVLVLRSPIVNPDKKNAIIEAVTKGRIENVTAQFIKLLVNKGRETNLPEMIDAFIDQYNVIKGINRVKLTTATAVGENVINDIVNKVKAETGYTNIDLETVVDPKLIGGFILDYNNNRIDASVLRDLQDIKKQFSENTFVSNIR
ncbi:ATP synthase F1 subunit delta [Danxiaibacter flavus]|uniref:ATP synthase subunit delta n=1 Tax=Danxiaibacter flavus TaxID=3049108 RepID=A0ABV3ZHG9_9BACT|nr:ATP synthase F1 subunit delta [Chitinophagaceae bacterium DXS]